MTKSIDVKPKVQGLKQLDKYINFVNKFTLLKDDVQFQQDFRQWVLDLAIEVSNNLLIGGTTNDEAISTYISNHKIREIIDGEGNSKGFILYNDTKIPAIVKGKQNDIENYPDEMFNVALAFEYGVGIIGPNTNAAGAWEYNIQGYNFGWYLPKEVAGESGIQTAGYAGFEIYRNIAIEAEKRLNKWIEDYYRKR